MGIDFTNITCIYPTVSVNIGTDEFIAFKYGSTSCMGICPAYITGVDFAVPVDIAFQMYFYILRYRLGSYCNRILPCDMIFLRYFHGVSTGSNA